MLNLFETQKKHLSQSFGEGLLLKKNYVTVFQYTFPGGIVHVLDEDEPRESFTTHL